MVSSRVLRLLGVFGMAALLVGVGLASTARPRRSALCAPNPTRESIDVFDLVHPSDLSGLRDPGVGRVRQLIDHALRETPREPMADVVADCLRTHFDGQFSEASSVMYKFVFVAGRFVPVCCALSSYEVHSPGVGDVGVTVLEEVRL